MESATIPKEELLTELAKRNARAVISVREGVRLLDQVLAQWDRMVNATRIGPGEWSEKEKRLGELTDRTEELHANVGWAQRWLREQQDELGHALQAMADLGDELGEPGSAAALERERAENATADAAQTEDGNLRDAAPPDENTGAAKPKERAVEERVLRPEDEALGEHAGPDAKPVVELSAFEEWGISARGDCEGRAIGYRPQYASLKFPLQILIDPGVDREDVMRWLMLAWYRVAVEWEAMVKAAIMGPAAWHERYARLGELESQLFQTANEMHRIHQDLGQIEPPFPGEGGTGADAQPEDPV